MNTIIDATDIFQKARLAGEVSQKIEVATALMNCLALKDNETAGHSERVVRFSVRIGQQLLVSEDILTDLKLGSLLHDIGKIGVRDAVLKKPGKLDDFEWTEMKMHPIHGGKILAGLPSLAGAFAIVTQHHERFDGSGYPFQLSGTRIDITARIFAVADTFDAITSDRCYRRAGSYWDALGQLDECSGTQFDPKVVEAFTMVPQVEWDQLRLGRLVA